MDTIDANRIAIPVKNVGGKHLLKSAFGLTFESEIDLPELPAVEAAGDGADVTIRYDRVSEHDLKGATQVGPLVWASPTELMLHIPDVGRWIARDGREILIDPSPGIDEDSLRLFMLGSVFAAILLQRGLFVLHGCAIRHGDGVIVAVGPSGIGKSTLAEGFRRRGFSILADDVVATDGAGRALPGIPRIKLWQDVTEHLGLDRNALRRVRPGMDKFDIALGPQHLPDALPVKAVYALAWHHPDEVKIAPENRMAAFKLLLENSYRQRFVDGMKLQSRHLAMATAIAGEARIARLFRPRDGFSLEAMVDGILNDIRD